MRTCCFALRYDQGHAGGVKVATAGAEWELPTGSFVRSHRGLSRSQGTHAAHCRPELSYSRGTAQCLPSSTVVGMTDTLTSNSVPARITAAAKAE